MFSPGGKCHSVLKSLCQMWPWKVPEDQNPNSWKWKDCSINQSTLIHYIVPLFFICWVLFRWFVSLGLYFNIAEIEEKKVMNGSSPNPCFLQDRIHFHLCVPPLWHDRTSGPDHVVEEWMARVFGPHSWSFWMLQCEWTFAMWTWH